MNTGVLKFPGGNQAEVWAISARKADGLTMRVRYRDRPREYGVEGFALAVDGCEYPITIESSRPFGEECELRARER